MATLVDIVICLVVATLVYNNQKLFFHSGGPVVIEETNVFGEFPRFMLLGTIHGSFSACSNSFPGIFVETDDISVLEFLHKQAYGSG